MGHFLECKKKLEKVFASVLSVFNENFPSVRGDHSAEIRFFN